MSFEVTTATPTSPPTAAGRLVGTGAGPTYPPQVFNVADFATKDASGNVGLGGTATQALDIIRSGASVVVMQARNASHTVAAYAGSGATYLGSLTASEVNVLYNGSAAWTFTSSAFRPATDNAYAFGGASNRATVLWAVTGTISTSDMREKNWLGALADVPQRDAYLAAARDIEDNLGLYQWLDAVAEKGEDARWHFGALAQAVMAIFMAHGLEEKFNLDLPTDKFITKSKRPRFRHAFLCFDTWDEVREPVMKLVKRKVGRGKNAETVEEWKDTGKTRLVQTAGNRFGFRTDQLLALLLAANALMRREIEDEVSALKAALPSLISQAIDATLRKHGKPRL
jgi:hypothetical protein